MHKGTIIELTERDSGFIEQAGHADKLFFHADHLIDISFKSLSVGDVLEFTIRDTNKGPYAVDISRVEQ